MGILGWFILNIGSITTIVSCKESHSGDTNSKFFLIYAIFGIVLWFLVGIFYSIGCLLFSILCLFLGFFPIIYCALCNSTIKMKISCEPDDTELTINIDGGVLSFIGVEEGIDLEASLSESDMDYLKKRLIECWKP